MDADVAAFCAYIDETTFVARFPHVSIQVAGDARCLNNHHEAEVSNMAS